MLSVSPFQEGKGPAMVERPLVVQAQWDEEARVWVAESTDVPGLVTEAETIEKLEDKLRIMIPELLELNGRPDVYSAGTPISLIATKSDMMISAI